jgi:predicted HD phosphohydrolase
MSFHEMTDGTREDWARISTEVRTFNRALPERVLAHLELLAGDYSGFAVDRLTHCLQTATRAERANRSDAYVLCALLHDIGDTLGSHNHQDVAAAIVWPFVEDDLHWLVAHHGEFQGYYYFDHLGLDRHVREQYRGHEHFDLTAEFCADFDQNSFDPNYPTQPLEHFAPLVQSIMGHRPQRSIYQPR